MAIDYDALAAVGGIPKGKPKMLLKAERNAQRADVDQKESAKVKVRSGGRCEVQWFGKRERRLRRCERRASQVHHMYGGIGVRARGKSALAEHKQHVCDACHPLITGKVLRRVGGDVPLWTDEYERVDR